MIDAKLAGKGVETKKEEPADSNVIDLMAALKKGLGTPVAKSADADTTPKKAKKPAGRSLRKA